MVANFHEIIFPHYQEKVRELTDRNCKFAHYASAEVAISILKNKEVWLRNAAVMNDFREIEHGLRCLNMVLNGCGGFGKRFSGIVDELMPGKFSQIMMRYVVPKELNDTYITCLSAHGPNGGAPSEDKYGRLSMWRAYGGSTNVALVFDRDRILNADVGPTLLSPVLYADVHEFRRRFGEVLDSIGDSMPLLKTNPSFSLQMIVFALDAAVLSTKHPGFAEEQEWRVIYRPSVQGGLPCEVKSVGGVPQKIHLLPLDGNSGPKLDDALDHIIIGPTQFPHVIGEALVEVMEANGYHNPNGRVRVSDIPLRR